MEPDAPSCGAKAETTAATPYPPLRTVLQSATLSHNEQPTTALTEVTSADAARTEEGVKAIEVTANEDDRTEATAAVTQSKHLPEDTSYAVSVHPPSSAKPKFPSRHTSMARLRQQQQQQLWKPAVKEEGTEDAAAAPVLAAAADVNGIRPVAQPRDGVHLFWYRPILASPAPSSTSSSSSSSNDGGATHATSDRQVSKRSKEEVCRGQGPAKVLPRELRSPSGGTEVGVALEDSADHHTSQDDSDVRDGLRESGCYADSQPRRSPAPRPATEAAALLPYPAAPTKTASGAAAVAAATALEASAPFHALQFVLPPPYEHLESPPQSGRSELENGGDSGGAVGYDRISPAGSPRRRGEEAGHRDDSHLESHPAQRIGHTGEKVAGGEELMECPFALFGCCPRGTHTTAEVQGNTLLHHHLVAVAGCLRRMKARQQQLEHNVVLLQHEIHTQTNALHATTAQLERFQRRYRSEDKERSAAHRNTPVLALERQQRRLSRRKPGAAHGRDDDHNQSLPRSAGDVSLSGSTMESVNGAGGLSHKTLPGDVSLHEPQVTGYGADEEDDDSITETQEEEGEGGDVPVANFCELDEGGYARHLRQRTRSATRLYALRERAEEHGRAGKSQHRQTTSSAPVAAADAASGSGDLRTASAQQRSGHRESVRSQRSCDKSRSTPSFSKSNGKDVPRGFSGEASTKHSSFAGPSSPYDVQRGACGSTEVSGMSNVPPYQLPNESVSTISSASFDLNDHEDDTDVGKMRQQLLYLSTGGAGRETSTEAPMRAARAPRMSPRPGRAVDEQSARSIPSLVSTTYRPSQLAHASAATEGVSESAERTPPTRSAVAKPDREPIEAELEALKSAEGQQPHGDFLPVAVAVTTVAGDGVRLAAPLQRPTLIRKVDVAHDKGLNKSPLVLPRAVVPATTTAGAALPSPVPLTGPHGGSTAPLTSAIRTMSNAATLRPRRLQALDSEGKRVTAVGFHDAVDADGSANRTRNASIIATHHTVDSNSQNTNGNGRDCAEGPSGRATRSTTPNLTAAHAYSYQGEEINGKNDNAKYHSTRVVMRKKSTGGTEEEEQVREEGESAKRSSHARSRRDSSAAAASRRSQHATSLLSVKEAGELGELVRCLGLPPRRVEQ
ncbi:hypothetical protein ABB37_08629 [Leptomonas pyrrhocoris]|uniref:Uncharacterized protein n=1 Tax=Leptomonas pyrrhocoris TaxID=157538 RepID=A0A0M9FT50_LEPPY|nr:hypothetical protein ABB37_08629 [Leptomonas pyrrhocoris]KPA75336.1 hypothetical protein ABB37_08629 [Leptomonas pyrrhocoris]|eukprot:XP_015653775.1 hypothetical protein ABB37_08629 [Leptomonas pyrrhocoris]